MDQLTKHILQAKDMLKVSNGFQKTEIEKGIENLTRQKQTLTNQFVNKANSILANIREQYIHIKLQADIEQAEKSFQGGKAKPTITHSRTSEKIKCKDGVVRVVFTRPDKPYKYVRKQVTRKGSKVMEFVKV